MDAVKEGIATTHWPHEFHEGMNADTGGGEFENYQYIPPEVNEVMKGLIRGP